MSAAPAAQLARLGKFEIRRVLGRGAQSVVYLAHDPDLRREVAIKLLKARGADAETVRREARTVSQLRHPHIVPIFELGEEQGQIYLVFELVQGQTLDHLLKQGGALPPQRCAEIMIAVLDAVAAAHDQGVIHHDLKPSNILLDASGAPRVMDFGIAARLSEQGGVDENLLGSPAYMAPEYITRRVVNEQYDVFSAGLILYEMAFGRRAVQGDNAFQAMHQIANVPLLFPANAGEALGPVLQDVIVKATAKEPELRYGSARQMKQALEAYLRPSIEGDGSSASGQQSTLEFLMRRLKVKGDFPAMSEAIGAIQRMAASDLANVNHLSNAILKDFALTNKILRLVNSVYYANRSGERIRTVSRAIVMMGFDTVRSIAISLLLFDRVTDKQHAAVLRDEFLRANLNGMIARELSAQINPARAEEAFICGLFHHLGRLLAQYYFWEEAEMIRKLTENEKCSEVQAALRVLGISYQDLGIGAAQSWGFPQTITDSMRAPPPGKLKPAQNAEEQLTQLTALAAEMGDALEAAKPAQRVNVAGNLLSRYQDSLCLPDKKLESVVQRSVDGLSDLAATLNINLRQSALGKNLLAPAAPAVATAKPNETGSFAVAVAESAAEVDPVDAEAILSAGIQDISKALVEDMPLSDLLRIVAETIYRALGVQRVLMCTRDGRTNQMKARFGFGEGADDIARSFEFNLSGTDLFNSILGQDNGVLIRDATETKIANRLPDWYRSKINAPSFVIFPMNIRKTSVAMIYADLATAGGLVLPEKQLSLLHTLRNQALLAIKSLK